MTKSKRAEWLEACQKLLESYKKGEACIPCPLCEVALGDRCSDECLWYLFEGKGCARASQELLNNSILFTRNLPKWHAYRIPQLERWIKRLERPKAA